MKWFLKPFIKQMGLEQKGGVSAGEQEIQALPPLLASLRCTYW